MVDIFDDEDAGEDLPDSSAQVWCPYCGAEVELLLDPGGGPVQDYVEDCEVCCRPWHLTVRWDADGTAWVEARSEEE
jgi:hypothetical protein